MAQKKFTEVKLATLISVQISISKATKQIAEYNSFVDEINNLIKKGETLLNGVETTIMDSEDSILKIENQLKTLGIDPSKSTDIKIIVGALSKLPSLNLISQAQSDLSQASNIEKL